MCFVTLLVYACVPRELKLAVGKSTIGSVKNVTCMRSWTKRPSKLEGSRMVKYV